MRLLIETLSRNAKSLKSNFIILPQNGLEILKTSNELNTSYIQAIDGVAAEGLYFGYNVVDQENTTVDIKYFESYLGTVNMSKKAVFAIDYCSSENNIVNSLNKNSEKNHKLFINACKNLAELPNIITPLSAKIKPILKNW